MTDGTTPLIALDAAVIDTETTGARSALARVCRTRHGAHQRAVGSMDASFRRLVNPGEPIPPAATAVHGIDDRHGRGRAGIRGGLAGVFAKRWAMRS